MNPIRGFGRAPQDPLNETPARLEPRDLARLSLSWSSNYTLRDLEQHLLENPGLSWWMPSLNEYLVSGLWRHRTEIVVIQELTARIRGEELVGALVAECRQRALRLVVMLDQYEIRRDSFYSRIGFALLQNIIIYELPRLPRMLPPPGHLRFVPLSSTTHEDLLQVDHAAFPWLWWNSAAEFAAYAALYGVEIFVGYEQGGAPVAYVGITSYRGWGHLDRIAVIPDRQGTGYGLEALNFAIARLSEHGARRVGLSTQADNIRSQHLYETYGFRRTNSSDYTIYGQWLDDESQVTG